MSDRAPEDKSRLQSAVVPIVFFTIVAVLSRIEERFPGGDAVFRSRYPSAKHFHGLRSITVMSSMDLDHLLDSLEAFGLRPGIDFGVGEMFHGEWLPCTFVEFEKAPTTGALPAWIAFLTEPAQDEITSND